MLEETVKSFLLKGVNKMVGSVVGIQSWVVVTISASALFVTATILFMCVCCRRKNGTTQFYILDEYGIRKGSITEYMQNSSSNLKLYRRLSSSKESKDENVFTSKNLPLFKLYKDANSESELVDSQDGLRSFDNSTLQLVDNESQAGTKDELRSCISANSWRTFYSALPPLTKSNSRTSMSVEYNSDIERF